MVSFFVAVFALCYGGRWGVVVVKRWWEAAIVIVLVVILGHCWVDLVIVVESAEIVEGDGGGGVGEGVELRS